MATTKVHYSARTGASNKVAEFDLGTLRKRFYAAFEYFRDNNYFSENLKYHKLHTYKEGASELSVANHVYRDTGKELWPIELYYAKYDEDDIFDMVEFLYNHVSLVGDTAAVLDSFTQGSKNEWREEVNKFLPGYKSGFVLSSEGEIEACAAPGFSELLDQLLLEDLGLKVKQRVHAAIKKFRKRNIATDERHDAVCSLADVLEKIRPQAKEWLTTKDEQDLFNILNNFGIRHHNDTQQDDYDPDIFYEWLFYHLLAAIHAVLKLFEARPAPC